MIGFDDSMPIGAMTIGDLKVLMQEIFETALIISDALLNHTTKIFEELSRLAASGSSAAGQKTIRRQLFLDKLPESFTRKQFIDISASLGIPLKTAERHISQWGKDGLIERIEQGKYLKR